LISRSEAAAPQLGRHVPLTDFSGFVLVNHAGFEIVEVPVDAQGVVRLDALRDALREDTALVSIMAANNETGVLEPVAEIGRLIRERCPAALFHTTPEERADNLLCIPP
jgi:Aminotransferase class-V